MEGLGVQPGTVGEDAADEALGRHVTCSIAEFDGQKAEGITLRSSNEKQDAVDAGRKISQNQGTEFYIHGKDGKIQNVESSSFPRSPGFAPHERRSSSPIGRRSTRRSISLQRKSGSSRGIATAPRPTLYCQCIAGLRITIAPCRAVLMRSLSGMATATRPRLSSMPNGTKLPFSKCVATSNARLRKSK